MARRLLRLGLLGALVGIAATTGGWAAPVGKPGAAVDAAQLPAGTFTGKLVSLPDADRIFTVNVQHQQVIPNPSNGRFIVSGDILNPGGDNVIVELADMLGHVLLSRPLQTQGGKIHEELTAPGNAPGMYVLSVRAGAERLLFRIVIE